MNMNELHSTPERERILKALLTRQGRRTMREIAKEADVSPAQVHKYLRILEKGGVVKGNELLEVPLVHSLRLSQNLLRLEEAKAVEILRKRMPGIKGIGIFGSWSRGTNLQKSDLDIWVKVDRMPALEKTAEARRELGEKLGAEIDLTLLDKEKIKANMEKNPPFYFSLFYSILLWGEGV